MQPLDGLRVGWDGHILLAYASERERGAAVAAWVRRGLEAGARIVYVEPLDDSDTRPLAEVMKEYEIDVTPALARGQLQLVEAAEAELGAAWQEAVAQEGLRAGYPAVQVAGEASASWRVMSPEAHRDAERAAETLCGTRPVSVLCQYAATVEPALLTCACALHGAGTRGARLQTVPVPGGVALVGEVDSSNQKLVRSVLAAACDGVDGHRAPVLVDLRDLEFLDTAGSRALLMATTAYRGRGGLVRLHAARPSVDRLLRLLGVDRTEGIILEDAA